MSETDLEVCVFHGLHLAERQVACLRSIGRHDVRSDLKFTNKVSAGI
jgi:hypothetical protein